jgi:murein DD-endopeptidase MepM/ murein hydrolase activator NlpD
MDRRFPTFALLALALLPLLTACMPDTPETVFAWDVNDQMAARHRAPAPAPARTASNAGTGTRVYAYQEAGDTGMAPPVPTPRPAYHVSASSAPVARAPYRAAVAPVPAGDVAFAWPVNGAVISGFGAGTNGERNDGINIAASRNTPIRAAASGTVSYADTLNGYGELVLIKHSNGYVTAYAHADRLLVSRGDFVAKGQVIGYAGTTGDVTSPQLHFEIRSGVTPVDPERYLSARAGA